MLRIQDLSVRVGTKTLIQDINIDVKSSDVNIIIGPNGAGKSTFLKAISKIIEPNSGKVYLKDKDIFDMAIEDISRDIAYMGQFNLGTSLSVIDILELSRRKYSGMLLSKDDYAIIDEIISEFHLQKFLHDNIDILSGGERQKVFLAAALIQKPKVLLLDEPISHLDPKNQIEILEIIKHKTKQKELITFIVLHDLQNALHYGDNIIMFKDKRIIEFEQCSQTTPYMIDKLYDVKCEMFWQSGHPFTFLKHTHDGDVNTHSHKGKN